MTASNGCDSTSILTLEVLPISETTIEVAICEGEEYEGYSEAGTYTDIFTGNNGCDSIRVLELTILPADDPDCMANAVDDAEAIVPVQVSPNPFKNHLNINCDCDLEMQVELYNMVGKKIMTQTIYFHQGNAALTINNLTPGIYILIGFDDKGNKVFSEKLIRG